MGIEIEHYAASQPLPSDARAAAEEIASTIAPVDWTFAPEWLLDKVAVIITKHIGAQPPQSAGWVEGWNAGVEAAAGACRKRRDAYVGVNAITVHEVDQCLVAIMALPAPPVKEGEK